MCSYICKHACVHAHHITYMKMENPKLNLYVPLEERGLAIMRNYLIRAGGVVVKSITARGNFLNG